MVACFLNPATPTDEIRERVGHLGCEHWRAFYLFAGLALKEEEKRMLPTAAEKRTVLNDEQHKRGP